MVIIIDALVNDAIIDDENGLTRLREIIRKPEEDWKAVLTVFRKASVEVRSSIIVTTLIIIVSFIPLFFLSGTEGGLLRSLRIALVTSVLTSLLVAVIVIVVRRVYCFFGVG